jgi:hypothetical protein
METRFVPVRYELNFMCHVSGGYVVLTPLSFNVTLTTPIAEIIATLGDCTRNILNAIEFKLYK